MEEMQKWMGTWSASMAMTHPSYFCLLDSLPGGHDG